jgi:hypothetical protein
LAHSATAALAIDWYQAKTFIEHAISFSHDALHVLVGVVVQLVIAALLRRSLRSIWPWLIVLALELGNEWVDLAIERWPVPAEQYGEGMKDILLTMALPTLLLLVARFRPRWLVSR